MGREKLIFKCFASDGILAITRAKQVYTNICSVENDSMLHMWIQLDKVINRAYRAF
jgi:hypothetical protein